MQAITYDKFTGFTLINEPTSLPLSMLIKGSRNIDLSKELNALKPRGGIESQFPSLGDGGIKGTHVYKRSSGEKVMFKWDNNLYTLSGENKTITKSTTADFADWTTNSVLTTNDELKLPVQSVTGALDTYNTDQTSTYHYNITVGQTFIPNRECITQINLWMGDFERETATVTVYDSPERTKVLGSKSLFSEEVSYTGYKGFAFKFDTPITGYTPGQPVYLEATSDGSFGYLFSTGNKYLSGTGYRGNYENSTMSQLNDYDLIFQVFGADDPYKEDDIISPVIDLGTTPKSASISWNATTDNWSGVVFFVIGSHDGVNWGDWQQISASGGGIPLTRYIKVKIRFLTNGTTAKVSDLTINYSTSLSQTTVIKQGAGDNHFMAVDYKDDCYLTYGSRPQRYNGTTMTPLGVDPPTALHTLATSGTGLSGTFKTCVTFVNSYGAESNAGPTVSITLTNQGIAWSNIPLGPTGTTKRKLYRTQANGSLFYEVTTIDNNTATTFTDTKSDANLLLALQTDNDLPPNCTIIHEHKNYMLYVDADHPERLYVSKVGLPDSVPAIGYRTFPGAIKMLKTYQNAVIVGGNDFLCSVSGDTWDASQSLDATVTRVISEEIGPVSNESAVQCFSSHLGGDVLIFPTKSGLGYLNPGQQEDSLRTVPLSEPLQPIFDGAVNAYNMAAVAFKNRYILALDYYGTDTPTQTNNIILCYDLRTGQWSPPWDISASGFCINDGRCLFGSSTSGQLFELDKGTSDDGQPINKVVYLAPVQSDRRMKLKKARIAVGSNSDTSTLQVNFTVDGDSEDVSFGAIDTWDSESISNREPLSLGKGYRCDVVISDNSVNDWTITKLIAEYQRC